jgi:hypothetical protein
MAVSVRCALFVDGKLSAEVYHFAAVPRVGETILVRSDELERVVENVRHIAQGAVADRPEPHVQIHAKIRSV